MKRVGAALLAVMVMLIAPASVSYMATGDGAAAQFAVWDARSDRVASGRAALEVVLSPEGLVCELSEGAATIVGYQGTAADLVIPEQLDGNPIRYIGGRAFESQSNLQSVSLPSGLISIGDYAFSECRNLADVDFANASGLQSIGIAAFRDCSELAGVRIPDSVTSIGGNLFANCTALKTAALPAGITSLPTSTFFGCTSLQMLSVPEQVVSIGSSAMSGCTSLEQVRLPAMLTGIGNAAFNGCSSLRDVAIPDGVSTIEGNTFRGCSSLVRVTLPDKLTAIGGTAFQNCSSLSELRFPKSLQIINAQAFQNCDALADIWAYNTLETVNSTAFQNVEGVKTVHYYGTQAEWNRSQLKAALTQLAEYHVDFLTQDEPLPSTSPAVSQEPTPSDEPSAAPSNPASGEPVSSLPPSAAPGSAGPEPSSAAPGPDTQPSSGPGPDTSTGPEPTRALEPLATDTPQPSATAAPTWIASASPSASQTLTPLPTDAPAPSAQESARPTASASAPGFIPLPEPDPASGLMMSADGLWIFDPSGSEAVVVAHSPRSTNVTVPQTILGRDGRTYTVTGVRGYQDGGRWRSFLYNTSIVTSVQFPGTLRSVGPYAFYGCSRLSAVWLPGSLKTIDTRSFSGCRGLTGITIPSDCSEIGSLAFENCTSLESIGLRGEATKIGSDAFKGCTKLREVVLGPKVRNLDPSVPREIPAVRYVFYGAGPQKDLEESDVPAVIRDAVAQGYVRDVAIIPTSGANWRFEVPQDAAPGSVVSAELTVSGLPSGTAQAQGELDLHGLALVDTGDARAFGSALVLPVQNGSASLRIMLRITGSAGETATLEWGSVTLDGKAVADNAQGEIRIEENNEDEELSSPDGLWTFELSGADGDVTLTSYAGRGTVVTIPRTVTDRRGRSYRVMGISGRRDADGVRRGFLRYPSGVRRVVLPQGISSIGPWTFYGYADLESVTLPVGLRSIGEQAFSGCTGLTDLILPEGLRSIGALAFENCSALRSVAIPGSASIEGHAFYGSSSVTEMRFSPQASVQRNFFLGLPALRTVWFDGSRSQLDASSVLPAFTYAQDEHALADGAQIYCDESPVWTLTVDEPVVAGSEITLRMMVAGVPAGVSRVSGQMALTGLLGGEETFSLPVSAGSASEEVSLYVIGEPGDTAAVQLTDIQYDAELSEEEPEWAAVILSAAGDDPDPGPSSEPSSVPSPGVPDDMDVEPFTVIVGSPLTVTGRIARRYVRGLTATRSGSPMQVSEFLSNFEQQQGITMRMTDADGKVLSGNEPVVTGDVLEAWRGSDCLGRATVVVNGDVLGTGRLSIAQLVRMASALNGSAPLRGAYLLAGKRTENSCMCITLADLLYTAKELL